MSDQDPPLTSRNPLQRRATSHPHEDSGSGSDSDRQRQKRRRIDVDSGVEYVAPDVDQPTPAGTSQPSTTLTQVSTWEMPSDVPLDRPAEKSPPIELSDSDDPIAMFPKTDGCGSPSRAPSVSAPEPLSAYTCPICFSPPTNATLTPCGHICCGACLFTAVKSTIRRNMGVAMERAPPPRCPVCRAEIPGWNGRGGGVIGLKIQALYSL